ncbi:DNA-3-methyladenine glycosylase 2 family protein [Candidatus Phycosocius spiralis]|uniref:DNA-3-methyladenine glycosylase II n=1 Tax=Candidatus Phycosocius spiralis TaxID=2815099 RepID=A0ABQ4PXB7_9PROT|nr:AlkA N-terminal domain-containing protein [Candidatus Phycosocius spiralis]GIU67658.1 AraC family transcriptional regulator [Candidatus Phycosocius spiralis]
MSGGSMFLDPDTCYRIISARDARYDGRFFTAVTTTGIYCRPICPARIPERNHVKFYPSAFAAQEHGFRPCLRCRPETAPDTPAWRGTATTIGRALRLIEEGVLDTGSVEGLAHRLGIGQRHLRRLFLKHVGASPSSVAQTRRLFLAKQLVHESTMSITDIALASGFSSVRRFNEAFHALFRRPPSALRSELGHNGLIKHHGSIVLKLRYRPPYDWNAISGFMVDRLYLGVERFEGGVYRRSFALDGQIGIISVTKGLGDWLQVEINCQDLKVLPLLLARIRACFDLGADPEAIDTHLKQDLTLSPLVEARPGLRVAGAFEPFEIGVRAILGQQVSVKAAIGLGAQLVAVLGDKLSRELHSQSGLTHLFPTATSILASDLSFLGVPASRLMCLKEFSQAYVEDPTLLTGPPDAVIGRLLAIKGIGPWTAAYIGLRALGDPDAFPFGDVALKRGLEDLGICFSDLKALNARTNSWRPWRAYAAQHIWSSLAS